MSCWSIRKVMTKHSNTSLKSSYLEAEGLDSRGVRLRQARMRAGLSIKDISEELNILPRHLDSIENDSADEALPKTFINGYMNSYARFLGVDPALLKTAPAPEQQGDNLAGTGAGTADDPGQSCAVDCVAGAEPSPDSSANSSPIPAALKGGMNTVIHQTSFYQHQAHRTYYGVGLVVLLMGGLMWMSAEPLLPPNPGLTEVHVETPKGITVESLDAELPPVASNSAASSDGTLETAALGASLAEAEMTPQEQAELVAELRHSYAMMGADNAALLAIEQRMAAKPLAAVVSYSGDSTRQESESVLHAGENGLMAGVGVITGSELAFFFSGDCWIKVVDGDDRVIYEAVAKANASLELKGQPPFKVTLGYAPAVQVSYNGEPVEIDTRQGRNVARLVLGS
jgi:cytoskeleton protein RodZ